MEALISGLLKSGAPWGILCAVLSWAAWHLWQRCNHLADKVYELAVNQVKVQTDTQHALRDVGRDVEDISRRFEIHHENRRPPTISR